MAFDTNMKHDCFTDSLFSQNVITKTNIILYEYWEYLNQHVQLGYLFYKGFISVDNRTKQNRTCGLVIH